VALLQPACVSWNAPTALTSGDRPRVLFICGSLNQTTQMHQIARHLPELDPYFTPFFCDGIPEQMRRLGLLDRTIAGWRWRKVCMRYLRAHGLALDFEGRQRGQDHDLVVSCTDLFVPRWVQDRPLVIVQEGITDPERFWYWTRKVLPFIPRWAAGTAFSGTSNLYDRFCVASEGYRDHFVSRGADPARLRVTGIPNFDDCRRYHQNAFPHRGYLLVCTSDARETMKLDKLKVLSIDKNESNSIDMLIEFKFEDYDDISFGKFTNWGANNCSFKSKFFNSSLG